MTMEVLDIIILILLAAAAIMGFSRGLVAQAGQIAAGVCAVLACRFFGEKAVEILSPYITSTTGSFTTAAVYALLFLAVYLVVWMGARMIRSAIHTVHLGIIDRLGGALFKVALWALIISMVMNVYILAAGNDAIPCKPDKPWRSLLIGLAPKALGYMAHITAENVNK